MEMNENTVNELAKAWRNLYKEVQKNKKIKLDLFETAFNQTYLLLKSCSADAALDKQCVRLIAEAYLFASINDDSLENECLAATVLTERMLNNFAFHTSSADETATIYIIESHEEVLLNFNDVTESITKLKRIYDDAYWKKLAK